MNGYDENQVLKFVVLQAENKGKTNERTNIRQNEQR